MVSEQDIQMATAALGDGDNFAAVIYDTSGAKLSPTCLSLLNRFLACLFTEATFVPVIFNLSHFATWAWTHFHSNCHKGQKTSCIWNAVRGKSIIASLHHLFWAPYGIYLRLLVRTGNNSKAHVLITRMGWNNSGIIWSPNGKLLNFLHKHTLDKFTGNAVDTWRNVLLYSGLCPKNSNWQQHKCSNYSWTRRSSGWTTALLIDREDKKK